MEKIPWTKKLLNVTNCQKKKQKLFSFILCLDMIISPHRHLKSSVLKTELRISFPNTPTLTHFYFYIPFIFYIPLGQSPYSPSVYQTWETHPNSLPPALFHLPTLHLSQSKSCGVCPKTTCVLSLLFHKLVAPTFGPLQFVEKSFKATNLMCHLKIFYGSS